MNAITKIAPMIENPDGTFRYQGNMQWPMDRDAQQRAGLLAVTNRSIRPRHWLKGKTAKQDRGAEAS